MPEPIAQGTNRKSTPADFLAGGRLRRRRWEVGMSQAELGAAVGCSFQQIQKYENGRSRITVGRLVELGRALGVGPEFFFREPAVDVPELSKPTTELAAIYDAAGPDKQAFILQAARQFSDYKGG